MKGRKPFGKSIRKGEKGKNERVKCRRGRGKSRAEFDGETAREKANAKPGTKYGALSIERPKNPSNPFRRSFKNSG